MNNIEVKEKPAKVQIAELSNKDKIVSLLKGQDFKQKLIALLPNGMSPERFANVALSELRKTPKLANCSIQSFFACLLKSCQMGFEPGDALSHAYLVPYGTEVQLLIGYKGLIELAMRSGKVLSIEARAVFEGDAFSFSFGTSQHLMHVPSESNSGALKAVYAIARLKANTGDIIEQFEVLFKSSIDFIKTTYCKTKRADSPWNSHYEEMAKKTVVRRLCKYLPLSIEAQEAVILDSKGDVGKQNIQSEYGVLYDMEEEKKSKAEKLENEL